MSALPHGLYRGCGVAFLTRHGKQALVAQALEPVLGCRIFHTDAYDTDLLGSFTREVERAGSQLQAARRKARLGMELVGARVGVASEGAFDLDPFAGLLPWNVEMLLWLDDERGLEVVGLAQGPANNGQARVRTWEDLQAFALQAGFPSHHLVLRPGQPGPGAMRKGLQDDEALRLAFEQCRDESGDGSVLVETDLRAFCNPTRQQLIRAAAQDLARKLSSTCPVCGLPGYAAVRHVPGLPCRDCGAGTSSPQAHVWACGACAHEQARPVQEESADPARCGHCNP